MMAPLPPPEPPADPPAADGVRLAVRIGAGRTAVRAIAGNEFLVGGAAGCDLRLAGANLPPVVCQFTPAGPAAKLRRLAPGVTVLLNGIPLLTSDAAPLADGDRVTVGPAEITVHLPPAEYVVPKLVPVEDEPEPEAAALDRRKAELAAHEERLLRFQDELTELRESLARQQAAQQVGPSPDHEAELARRRAELEAGYRARLAELEADAVRRRQELEAEHDRRRTADEAVFADRLRQIEEEIARRRLQFELQVREYEPRFAELQLRRKQVEAAMADLARERQAVEAATAGAARAATADDAPLTGREEDLARREAELRAERERYAADLARLDRWQGTLDSRQEALDRRAAEIDARVQQLAADAAEREELVRLADGDGERLRAEADRLDRLKAELAEREAALAGRTAQVEAQQATLAVLRAKLDRQQEEARRESTRLAAEFERFDSSRRDLDAKLHEAERLRAELGTVRADHESQQRSLAEQQSLLAATLDDIKHQKETLAAEGDRLRRLELDLDIRSAEFAEQAAVFKARVAQVTEWQERLEADRGAIRDREASLATAEAARQALQEQLRKRAEELTARARQLDDAHRRIANDRAALERLGAETKDEKLRVEDELATARRDLDTRSDDLGRQSAALAEREAALGRQVARLKEVGRAVAAERKVLADSRAAVAAEQENATAFRAKVAEQMAELRRQAPDLETGARDALVKLAAARDVLRGHLAELHDFARQAREELDSARGRLRADADELERARSDHRLAVAGFRQQLVEWQARVAELKQTMARSESRLEQRQAEVDAAAKQVDATTQELSRKEAELRHERAVVAEKRSEMERHLTDMREWYRKKLRELASGRTVDESDMPVLKGSPLAPRADHSGTAAEPPEVTTLDDLDPGDRQLGELLQSRGLVDAETIHALWAEAGRQRRTLRQVLLASGVVTLYQLALIEAGNLDALVLGRFRVVDRVRATPRETVYRVFDPNRRGVFLLRHLAEPETHDAVRPDEFRQRFAAAAAAAHPNLANTLEVSEVGGRPAALQEIVVGQPSSDWPPAAALPAVWVRLLADAARGLGHAHRAGLVHGRLAAESFVLTAGGTLKLLGLGEPSWLAGNAVTFDPPPAADLRALGQVAFGWSQLGGKRRGARAKPFPPELAAIVRRLESGAEPPMADVVAFDRPYADAGELVRELEHLAADHPLPADAWAKLTAGVAEALHGSAEVRQSA
jgi:chromosome segregation ATPase